MGNIRLEKMLFYGYHGVYPEENKLGQRFYVDVAFSLDLVKAGESDRLEHTIDYAEAYAHVQEIMEGTPCQLIEKLASDISDRLLRSFPKVREVTVKITKPDPPIRGYYEAVSVEITREQQ